MSSFGTLTSRGAISRVILAGLATLMLAGCSSVLGNRASEVPADARAGDSGSAASTVRLARASRNAGDFASAVNLYRAAVSADPQDAELEVELGDTLVDAGSYDDAINVFNHVDAKSPARVPALLGLMRVELALNEATRALAYADAAKALAPADNKVLIGRGVALDMAGRHGEAQQSYRAVITADPHDLAARNNLALSLALTGGFDEAIEIMKPIALSSNATPRCRQNLALIYGLKGDDDQAASLSRLDLDPSATTANLRFFDLVRTSRN